MSVEINNESGLEADTAGLLRLADFALERLRIHPQAELSVVLVDEDTMSVYHEKYMGEKGPTDVLSFPMDELRPPAEDDEPPEGLLGDIVLCPAVTARQAAEHGRTADAEAEYLLVHGLLHLLGYDHANPEEQAEMFGLKDDLLAAWGSERDRRGARGTRVR
jgi:probable rRNA maturation factor